MKKYKSLHDFLAAPESERREVVEQALEMANADQREVVEQAKSRLASNNANRKQD